LLSAVPASSPWLPGGEAGKTGWACGGAWVIDRADGDNDLLVGVIHGGARKGGERIGLAVQPAAFRRRIDKTIAQTGDKARSQPLDEASSHQEKKP
jgi:hypothetical protein